MILISKSDDGWDVYTAGRDSAKLVAKADAVVLSDAIVKGDKILGTPISAYGIEYFSDEPELMSILTIGLNNHIPGWLDTKVFMEGGQLVVGRKVVAGAKMVTAWGNHIAMSKVKYVQHSSALHTGSAFTRRRA